MIYNNIKHKDDFAFKVVEYQKSLVFPRVLKAKNEGQGKSSDSSPSRGALITLLNKRGWSFKMKWDPNFFKNSAF